jgi:hypothetical protein
LRTGNAKNSAILSGARNLNFPYGFRFHDYLEDDLVNIKLKVEELLQMAQRAHSRARYKPEAAKPMGFYLSLQDFRWSLDHYLKKDN